MSLTPPPPLFPGLLQRSRAGGPLLPSYVAYMVCYKLTLPEENYGNLINELRDQSFRWMHFIPNVWFVLRRETLVDLAQLLRACILGSDWLLVTPAKGPGDGILPVEAWNWIREFIPREF
jgi:hypothetical protein